MYSVYVHRCRHTSTPMHILAYMYFIHAHVCSMSMTLYLCAGVCTLTADNSDRESGCRIAQNS